MPTFAGIDVRRRVARTARYLGRERRPCSGKGPPPRDLHDRGGRRALGRNGEFEPDACRVLRVPPSGGCMLDDAKAEGPIPPPPEIAEAHPRIDDLHRDPSRERGDTHRYGLRRCQATVHHAVRYQLRYEQGSEVVELELNDTAATQPSSRVSRSLFGKGEHGLRFTGRCHVGSPHHQEVPVLRAGKPPEPRSARMRTPIQERVTHEHEGDRR